MRVQENVECQGRHSDWNRRSKHAGVELSMWQQHTEIMDNQAGAWHRVVSAVFLVGCRPSFRARFGVKKRAIPAAED